MQNIPKLNLPECYVIFLHGVVFVLFKLNLTAFEADHVIVEHSFSKTETLCEPNKFQYLKLIKKIYTNKNRNEEFCKFLCEFSRTTSTSNWSFKFKYMLKKRMG